MKLLEMIWSQLKLCVLHCFSLFICLLLLFYLFSLKTRTTTYSQVKWKKRHTLVISRRNWLNLKAERSKKKWSVKQKREKRKEKRNWNWNGTTISLQLHSVTFFPIIYFINCTASKFKTRIWINKSTIDY